MTRRESPRAFVGESIARACRIDYSFVHSKYVFLARVHAHTPETGPIELPRGRALGPWRHPDETSDGEPVRLRRGAGADAVRPGAAPRGAAGSAGQGPEAGHPRHD